MNKKAEETRLKIREAAIKLFSEKGFEGTATREIAAEAGVAEGTIFRYFPAKNDILLNIAEEVLPRMSISSMESTFQRYKDREADEILKAFLKERMELFKENFELIKIIWIEAQFKPDLLQVHFEKTVRPTLALIEDYISLEIEKGVFRELDPVITARAVMGTFFAHFFLNEIFTMGKKLTDIEKELDEHIDIILNGIAKGD